MKQLNLFLRSNFGFFIILSIIVFAIYGKTINYEFTNHDDDVLITRNINFISEFKNIPKLFTTSCYYSDDFPYYRPILTLSFAIETILFGNNTKIFHLSNIILFILSIYLMYVFISRLKQNSVILKFICILIAVHPVFSSSIAWIPARNDTLLLIFTYLSFVNLTEYIKFNKNMNLSIFIVTFFIALLTKETAVILLPTYIVFIYTFDLKINKNQIIKIIFYLLPIIAFYLYLRNISITNNTINTFESGKHIWDSLNGIAAYISKILIPDYIPVMLYKFNITPFVIVLNLLLFLLLLICLNKKLINIKILLFGFFWMIIWLLPTFVAPDSVFLFHRLLIPITGLIIIFYEIINNAIKKFPVLKKYFIFIFIILFPTYFFASSIQAKKFTNSDTYWVNAYYDAPIYHGTCYFISKIYLKNNDYQKAKEFLYKAIEYSNNSPLYSSDLALIYAYEKNYENAKKEYLRSIEANINVAYSFRNLSGIYLYQNDMKNAYLYAEKAFNLEPYNIDFSIYTAKIYALSNEYQKAIYIYLNLIKHDKKNAQYYYKAAELYELMKDYKNAKKYITQGLKLAPENAQLIEKAESLKKIKNDSI